MPMGYDLIRKTWVAHKAEAKSEASSRLDFRFSTRPKEIQHSARNGESGKNVS